MAIGCGDIWGLANALAAFASDEGLDPGAVEPIRRAAIGRAYYAVYHRGLLYASALDYDEPDAGSGHTALWNWYVARGGSYTLLGNLGFAMHRRRKIADYDLGANCPSLDDQIEEGNVFGKTIDPLEETL